MIGHIRASNIEDPDSREYIELGYVTGDGLLGVVVDAICKLVREEVALGRSHISMVHEEVIRSAVKKARLELYDALKAIEEAA